MCKRSKQFGALIPTPPQAFRASFPQKTGNSAKGLRPKKAKLVTTWFLCTPQFFMISAFQQTQRQRVPIGISVSSYVSAETVRKTLIENGFFSSKNQLASKLHISKKATGTKKRVELVLN